jgi:hypothetical protein
MPDRDEPTAYVAEHIREELVRHPDVGELDLHVSIDGERVVVTGHVSTKDRSDVITRVLGELLPGKDVRNETTVAVYPEAPEATSA